MNKWIWKERNLRMRQRTMTDVLSKLFSMKIDMTPEAITRRLKIENALKRACLSLANSSSGKEKLKKFSADKMVLRTVRSIGR
jgi:hypothetical protein